MIAHHGIPYSYHIPPKRLYENDSAFTLLADRAYNGIPNFCTTQKWTKPIAIYKFYFEFTVMEKLYAGLSVNSWKMVSYVILIFIVTFKYLVPLAHRYIKSVIEKEEHAN